MARLTGAERLARWRERLGISQQEACAIIDIDAPGYSRIEAGKRVPGLKIALRIASATSGAVPVESWRAA